jgi:hypothetical protein
VSFWDPQNSFAACIEIQWVLQLYFHLISGSKVSRRARECGDLVIADSQMEMILVAQMFDPFNQSIAALDPINLQMLRPEPDCCNI